MFDGVPPEALAMTERAREQALAEACDPACWDARRQHISSETKANQAAQDAICGRFLAACYRDDPRRFLSRFDGLLPRWQTAITRAVAVFLGCDVADVDQLWVETREHLLAEVAL